MTEPATRTVELQPLQFIEAPVAVELDPECGWLAWDSAVSELDRNTPEGRARDLFESVPAPIARIKEMA